MKTVYFVRHGETVANAQRVLVGATETPLTAVGLEQAHQVAAALPTPHIDLIVASSLSRAQDTAKAIAADIGYDGAITTSDLFTERNFGSAAGLSYDDAGKLLDESRVEGLESVTAFAERAQQAVVWLRDQQAKTILVVSHGAFGQMFATVLEGKNPVDFLSYPHLENAAFYTLTIADSAV